MSSDTETGMPRCEDPDDTGDHPKRARLVESCNGDDAAGILSSPSDRDWFRFDDCGIQQTAYLSSSAAAEVRVCAFIQCDTEVMCDRDQAEERKGLRGCCSFGNVNLTVPAQCQADPGPLYALVTAARPADIQCTDYSLSVEIQ